MHIEDIELPIFLVIFRFNIKGFQGVIDTNQSD